MSRSDLPIVVDAIVADEPHHGDAVDLGGVTVTVVDRRGNHESLDSFQARHRANLSEAIGVERRKLGVEPNVIAPEPVDYVSNVENADTLEALAAIPQAWPGDDLEEAYASQALVLTALRLELSQARQMVSTLETELHDARVALAEANDHARAWRETQEATRGRLTEVEAKLAAIVEARNA